MDTLEPPVQWLRIATDLKSTADLKLQLKFSSQVSDEPSYECKVLLNDELVGGFGWKWKDHDQERSLAELADGLIELSLSEEVWGGWPLCPRHKRPMWPTVSEQQRAVWRCEVDSHDEVEIGNLKAFMERVHS